MFSQQWRSAVHNLAKFASWTLFIYLGYCCLLFLLQRQILFPRGQIDASLFANKDIRGIEKIWIDTSSGKVETWFLPPAPETVSGPAPVVIFAHGNAELIDFCYDELKAYTRFGMGVLLIEYPGYGRSEGKPSQKSITETFVTAYDVLVSRSDIDSSRVVLYGRSLGGGAVCALAAQRPSAALILMSTFTSVRSFAKRHFVPGFMVRDPFDNLSVIRDYSGPVLIFHGKYDELIPYKHGVSLSQACQRGKFISYGCAHNDCPPNWDDFWQEIEIFLRKAEIIG